MGPEQLQQHKFSYIFVVSFIGGGNQITQWKPQTCHKSLINFIMCFIAMSGVQTLSTLMMIDLVYFDIHFGDIMLSFWCVQVCYCLLIQNVHVSGDPLINFSGDRYWLNR
jgi:hypothetical protein